jgi:hypothetical protein
MQRSKPGPPSIVFDAGHSEEVTPDESDLSQLRTLLQTNGFELATLHDPITPAALKPHRICVLGNPLSSTFSQKEVAAVEAYVKAGGGLLMVSGATIFGKGGDPARKTNLAAIAQRFGLGFSEKAIQPSPRKADADGAGTTDTFVATLAAQHPLSQGVLHLQFASATAVTPGTTGNALFRIGDAPAAPAVVVADVHEKGRVLALGGSTPFFNAYIGNLNHEVFLVGAFRWLAGLPPTASVHRLERLEQELEVSSESVETLREIRLRLDTFEKEVKEMKEVIVATIEELRRVLRVLQEGK